MLCQKCHKNLATVRYAEVVDGQVVDQHLCSACLSKHQESAGAGFELTNPTPTVRRGPSAARIVREAMRGQRSCSACGQTLSRIMAEGSVGCGVCYASFEEELTPVLQGLHHASRHKGKVAHLDDARARLREDIQNKRTLLRSMLKAENYEEAAVLRDAIRKLENGLYTAESGGD